jgi:hypothetical protein
MGGFFRKGKSLLRRRERLAVPAALFMGFSWDY